ncbi:hypothetical protein HOI18_01880 [Candidatus Uhrbacteria bacterium]|nr:hypothetical protein [Candidatus Uhrbacteria bacterium]
MTNNTEELEPTAEEQTVAKVVAGLVLSAAGVGTALSIWFLAPALAAFAIASPIVAAMVGGTGIMGFFAAAAALVAKGTFKEFRKRKQWNYVVLIARLYRKMYVDEDGTGDAYIRVIDHFVPEATETEEPEAEVDPTERIQEVIAQLQSQHNEMLEDQRNVAAQVAEWVRTRDEFLAEAEELRMETISADEAGDERKGVKSALKAKGKIESAERINSLIESTNLFIKACERRSDKIEVDVEGIEDGLRVCLAEISGSDLQEQAAKSHFGEVGDQIDQDIEQSMAIAALQTHAEERLSEAAAWKLENRTLLAQIRISDTARSRQMIEEWVQRDETQAASHTVPHSTPVIADSGTAPTLSGEEDNSRAARFRRLQAKKTL